MSEENISQKFGLKNIDETRNYLFEEVNPNELMSKKHKKGCATLNFIEQFLNVAASLDSIPIGIMSSAIG